MLCYLPVTLLIVSFKHTRTSPELALLLSLKSVFMLPKHEFFYLGQDPNTPLTDY
jgi:hypothetical protein